MWTINILTKRSQCKKKEIKTIECKFEVIINKRYTKDLKCTTKFKQNGRWK